MLTENSKHFICPYCEHPNSADGASEEGSHKNCNVCNRKFVCWSETDTIYFARDLEGGALLKAALQSTDT